MMASAVRPFLHNFWACQCPFQDHKSLWYRCHLVHAFAVRIAALLADSGSVVQQQEVFCKALQISGCVDTDEFGCRADCCDGSDESSGRCSNTCAQAGAAARAELKAKAAREAAGAKVKEGYVQQAKEDKQRWQEEAATLTQQIAQQQKLVDQWKGVYRLPHNPMPASELCVPASSSACAFAAQPCNGPLFCKAHQLLLWLA